MLPQGLSNMLSKVLARPRDRSVSSQATRSSLPDSFDVGLTYDWSESTLDTVLTRSKPTSTPSIGLQPIPSRASPGISLTTDSLLKEDPDIMLSSRWTPLSSCKTLSTDLENPFPSLCEQDMLNEPLSALMNPAPTAIVQSTYGRQLPMFMYNANRSSSISSRGFRYQTPRTSPRPSPLALPPSPASSTRTRPLFLPSPSYTPLQLEETYTDNTLTRKRKSRPSASFDASIRRSKRHRADLDIIDIDDDDDEAEEEQGNDDDWDPQLIDTGYQALRIPSFSVERTPAFDVEASVSYPGVSDNDDESRISAKQYGSHVSQTPALPRAGAVWLGPEGGAIKFKAKPANFNDKAFSRWSYSMTGPKSSTVSERTEGDIHFSPSNGLSTNESFDYWVCVRGEHALRWVDFSCGQPHPLYNGFVLKPANIVTKAPPKWVKAASYRASRD